MVSRVWVLLEATSVRKTFHFFLVDLFVRGVTKKRKENSILYAIKTKINDANDSDFDGIFNFLKNFYGKKSTLIETTINLTYILNKNKWKIKLKLF